MPNPYTFVNWGLLGEGKEPAPQPIEGKLWLFDPWEGHSIILSGDEEAFKLKVAQIIRGIDWFWDRMWDEDADEYEYWRPYLRYEKREEFAEKFKNEMLKDLNDLPSGMEAYITTFNVKDFVAHISSDSRWLNATITDGENNWGAG